jgi:hypothetical protein
MFYVRSPSEGKKMKIINLIELIYCVNFNFILKEAKSQLLQF